MKGDVNDPMIPELNIRTNTTLPLLVLQKLHHQIHTTE